MSDWGKDAIDEFKLLLDETRSTLEFVELSFWLRPRIGDFLNHAAVEGENRNKIASFQNKKSLDSSLIFRGILITLCGATEHLLRRLIEESVREINRLRRSYNQIPCSLQNQNIYRSSKALATIFRPLDHLSFDYPRLAKNLASCYDDASDYKLNPEAFGHSIVNATSSQIEELFQWLGLSLDWDDFGRDPTLQKHFNLNSTRDSTKQIKKKLNNLVSSRNKVAHTGIGGTIFTNTEITDFVNFLYIFAPILSKILSDKIKKNS